MSDALASEGIVIFLPFLLMQNGISLNFFPVVSASIMCGMMSGRWLGGLADRFGSKKMFIILETVMVVLLLIFTVIHSFLLAAF